MRILCFLRRGRDGVEADVGEKDNGSTAHHARETQGHERMPVRRINHKRTKRDEEHDDSYLHDYDRRVRGRAFPNPVDQQDRYENDNQECRQIYDKGMAHDGGECGRREIAQGVAAVGEEIGSGLVIGHGPKRKLEPEQAPAKLYKIARPAHSDGHIPDRVFKDQIPANDPGDDLPQSSVRVGVGGTGDRNHRCQFRVTERSKAAGDRRNYE